MQNAECKMQNAECKMQNAECKMENGKIGEGAGSVVEAVLGIPGFLLHRLFLARADPMLLDLSLDPVDDIRQAEQGPDHEKGRADEEGDHRIQLDADEDADAQDDGSKGHDHDRTGGQLGTVQVLIG